MLCDIWNYPDCKVTNKSKGVWQCFDKKHFFTLQVNSCFSMQIYKTLYKYYNMVTEVLRTGDKTRADNKSWEYKNFDIVC